MTYVKVLDSSHMVGFDVPDVTNDMIMRFMDVDISLLPGWTGMATSKVGEDERPAVHFGNSKQAAGIPLLKGGHGDWESWYNAISAVLILCTLGGIVGVYLYFRSRKGKGGGAFGRLQLPMASERDRDREAEERVPLAAEDYELDVRPPSSMGMRDGGSEKHKRSSSYKGKGKQKMEDPDDESDAERGESHTVFALGDEEEHER
jgi:carboxypeptidase D